MSVLSLVSGPDLPGSGCTVEDVLAATEFVVASIEPIDSRVKDWKLGPATLGNGERVGFGSASLQVT